MKKLLSVCLVFVMVMCFGVTALAEGGFVSSPSGNSAPEIVDSSDEGFVIHSYSERDQLPEDQRKVFEDSYDSIKNSDNLVDLNKDLNNIAKDKNVNPENLAVSDLFNVGYEGGNFSGAQSLTLNSDAVDNFVALMSYVNGVWKIVDDAKIQNGNLIFTVKDLGPYAIVVDTGDDTKSPQTGINETTSTENTGIAVYGVLMVVSAFGALFMWRKSKKYTA